MTTLTIRGHVGTDPKHEVSATGVSWTRFRVAQTTRWRTQEGDWKDGETSWFTVTCFNELARNVTLSVKKGDPIIAVGRLRIEEWEKEPGAAPVASAVLVADSIGHDLRFGEGRFARKQKPSATAEQRPGNVDDDGVISEPGPEEEPQTQGASDPSFGSDASSEAGESNSYSLV